MRGRTPAAAAAVAGLVALAGCGGGGGDGAVRTVSAEDLCRQVRSAEREYNSAAEAMGLQFTNRSVEEPTRRAAEALLLEVQRLERVSSGERKRRLAQLAGGLSNQIKTFEAFERHDEQEAARYGNSIQGSIARGLDNLRLICP
jgi:hypothetical protein